MRKGRQSKYDTQIKPNLDVILGLVRSGYSEESIAKRLGIGSSTWKRHKAKRSEFAEKLSREHENIGALCVNNLFKRANGYEYEEKTVETVEEKGQDGKLHIIRTTTKVLTKHMAPDIAANFGIICNRLADAWQNTQYIQHSGHVDSGLSDEECERIRKLLQAKHGNGNQQ